ncbi:NUMOD4 domain-containing protein [Corynebacterium glyciniphilum]|uniref:NUMOD4 domain-containing protein n=1 Tax=Corynebacterium glyciniphilum TaxID=1404244 RepID=UPI003FD1F0AC
MTKLEEWRTYPRCPIYEASSLGRIRSIDRVATLPNGFKRKYKGKILQPSRSKTGHLSVRLSHAGEGGTKKVHSIVIESFDRLRMPGEVVRHLNDDPTDNRIENLAFGSQKDNALDCIRNGGNFNKSKTECKYGHAFIPENLVIERGGNRHCKACSRARGFIYNPRNAHLPFIEVANSYYESIIKDGAPSVKVLEKENE